MGNYAGGVAGTNMKVKVGRDLLAMESGWVNADWASIPSMNLLPGNVGLLSELINGIWLAGLLIPSRQEARKWYQ